MNSRKVAYLLIFVKVLNYMSFVEADDCSGEITIRRGTKQLPVFNCTVIYGSIKILYTNKEDYPFIRFPNLREIRDYLLLSEVTNVTHLEEVFPNLTIIRGQKLFLNYALIIHRMNDLLLLNLKNLVAIQRGTVIVSENRKLCYLTKIYWDRLTLSPGQNRIYPLANCSNVCNGCDYCWSNRHCQKFENDNLLGPPKECHPNCIGGCRDMTDSSCNICRFYQFDNRCVSKCPANTFLSQETLKCVSKEECIGSKKFIHEEECVKQCPYGFNHSLSGSYCVQCEKSCTSEYCTLDDSPVQHLSDIEHLQGCEKLNTSLIIKFIGDVNIKDLERALGSLRKIEGILKIYRSKYIKSLYFFENLEYISGVGEENNQYSLLIHDNRNLEDLWKIKKSLKLGSGGIYIEKNWRICNNIANNFTKAIDHNRRFDRIQWNDKEVLCYPVKLNLYWKTSHNMVIIEWERYPDADTVELLYRESKNETDPMDTCGMDEYKKRIEYIQNIETFTNSSKTFMKYTLNNLKPNTKYELILKTYTSLNSEVHNEAQSDKTFIKTLIAYPEPIKWTKTKNKTSSSITIEWSLPEKNDVRSYVHIQLLEQKFNKTEIATRDYCKHKMNRGSRIYPDSEVEGCCGKMMEDLEARKFEEDIGNLFECSLDNPNFCDLKDNKENIILEENIASTEHTATFHNLGYAVYVIKIFPCNDIGCNNYYYHRDITLFTINKNAFKGSDVKACRKDDQYEIEIPKTMNSEGIITSLSLNFYDNTSPVPAPMRLCVSEKKHNEIKYNFKTNFKNLSKVFEDLQIETFSLAGNYHDPDYIKIDDCIDLADSVLISFMILIAVILLLGCYIFRKRIQHYVYLIWLKYRPQMPVDEEILLEEFETVNFSVY